MIVVPVDWSGTTITEVVIDSGEGSRPLSFTPSIIALLLAGAAQEPTLPAAVAGAKTYLPADFTRFAPKTALEMVRQVPGFTIRTGDDDRRGLGQATDNVVINGKRISAKADDPETVLGRISADNVVRIEIVDGATLNIPGLSGQVANIVTRSTGASGSFAWNPQVRARRTDPVWYDGEVSVNGELAGIEYSVSLKSDSRRNGNAGIETVTDPLGNTTDLRPEVLFVNEDRPKLSGTFKYETKDGAIANLSASYERAWQSVAEDSTRIDRFRDYLEKQKETNWEIGGDYDFALGGGRLKLIGLHRSRHNPDTNPVFFRYYDGRPDTGDRFDRVTDRQESILRSEFGWSAGKADWQIAAEGALNTLDNSATLASLDPAGVFVPVPLPGADAKVEEKRAEGNLSYGRPLSSKLRLQASIGGEYSQIAQSGSGGLTRTFYRPKGFVSLASKPDPKLDLSLKLSREVGQLDFFSFLSSVNLAGGTANAGNPNLRPPQSWRAELQATRNLGPWGSITARAFGSLISDIVDQVPIGPDDEAPGNLDKAYEYGIQIDATLTFDPIGAKGVKLDMHGLFQTNRVDDPLTGRSRRISETLSRETNVDLRWDIPATKWAVGANYNDFRQAPGYRLGQFSQAINSPGNVGLFVENKDVLGLTVRGTVDNLIATKERFYRTVYVGRRTGPIAFGEDRSRFFGPIFTVNVTGKF